MYSLGFSYKQTGKFYDLKHGTFSQKKHVHVLIYELGQLSFICNFYNCILVKYYAVFLGHCYKNNKPAWNLIKICIFLTLSHRYSTKEISIA